MSLTRIQLIHRLIQRTIYTSLPISPLPSSPQLRASLTSSNSLHHIHTCPAHRPSHQPPLLSLHYAPLPYSRSHNPHRHTLSTSSFTSSTAPPTSHINHMLPHTTTTTGLRIRISRSRSSSSVSSVSSVSRSVSSVSSVITGSVTSKKINALPIVYHPSYSAPRLAPGHRFPMQVFERIYQRLLSQQIITTEQVHGWRHHQHMLTGIRHVLHVMTRHQVHIPPELPTTEQLRLVHTERYLNAFMTGTLDSARTRRIGFGDVVHHPILIERTLSEVAGTLLTARLALSYGLAINTAGGTHHAFPDEGSGFCIINDLAVTTKVLLSEGVVSKVLIVDLDVHQGDGTAVCLADVPGAFTLSFHCESNFPARKQRSTMDIGLPDGMGDDAYMSRLADVLPDVINTFRPDIVLYDAGVDVHASDALGRLSLTDKGLARREALVMDTCLAEGIPVAGYVGGGYDQDLDVLADRHIVLHRTAMQLWKDYEL